MLIFGAKDKPTYLPMEVCEISPGQRVLKKLDEDQTANMVKVRLYHSASLLPLGYLPICITEKLFLYLLHATLKGNTKSFKKKTHFLILSKTILHFLQNKKNI